VKEMPLVVDGYNLLNHSDVGAAGIRYRGFGWG
jgi:hypothetical protein